jgi:hypothetical protein
MATLTIAELKNTTKNSRDIDDMRQYPLAIRQYLKNQKTKMDGLYDNRQTDTFLQRFRTVKYPVQDRQFGSPNEDICNIYLNMFHEKEVQQLIDDYTFDRRWIYHPVRKFEKWHTISNLYYNGEEYFWVLLIFNRIVNPFTALQDFNMIRVPNFTFLYDLPYNISFDYTAVQI